MLWRPREKEEQKVSEGLARTRQSLFSHLGRLLGGAQLTEDDWEEMEALLIQADVGVATTLKLVEGLRRQADEARLSTPGDARRALREELLVILRPAQRREPLVPQLPRVILVVGVNGTGKTTSIAKLAHRYQEGGWRVMLAAADTFRAGAIEQLRVWAERLEVPILAPEAGADPGAVAYDALTKARSAGIEVLIVDTAGRLHTSYNLMEELKKVHRVLAKHHEGAPHDVLLVVDATTGQNALSQARTFKEAVDVKGVVVAKLDGSARGGMVLTVASELALPIAYVGTGESLEDWAPFNAETFVDALLEAA